MAWTTDDGGATSHEYLIHFCQYGMDWSDGNIDIMAQMLVHEYVHALDLHKNYWSSASGECDATKIELIVLILNGIKPFKNNYWQTCDLSLEKMKTTLSL